MLGKNAPKTFQHDLDHGIDDDDITRFTAAGVYRVIYTNNNAIKCLYKVQFRIGEYRIFSFGSVNTVLLETSNTLFTL